MRSAYKMDGFCADGYVLWDVSLSYWFGRDAPQLVNMKLSQPQDERSQFPIHSEIQICADIFSGWRQQDYQLPIQNDEIRWHILR